MGTPIDPTGEYGNDCPTCTPSLFPVGETPQFITATITGDWTACPGESLPSDIWVLEQMEFFPCHWTLTASGILCRLFLSDPQSSFFIRPDIAPPHPYYFNSTAGVCATHFINALTLLHCGLGNLGYGGVCDITWLGGP